MKVEVPNPLQEARGNCLRAGVIMACGLILFGTCCYLSVPPSFWGDFGNWAGKIFP